MELISIAGAGVVLYCAWRTAKDELRCWRCYRAAAAKVEEKNKAGNFFRYNCLQMAPVSRR